MMVMADSIGFGDISWGNMNQSFSDSSVNETALMTNKRTEKRGAFLKKALGVGREQKTARIWNSRLSWRIALSVFLTILTVQMAILLIGIGEFEQGQLNDIREVGRTSLAPTLKNPGDLLTSPINGSEAQRVITTTPVSGFAVYNTNLDLLGTYGERVNLVLLDPKAIAQTLRTNEGADYEVVYRPSDLRQPYLIVAKLDSSLVSRAVFNHVRQTLFVMFLLSAFVTTVLMITLGKWLLEPILFMRDSLIRAADNPEEPNIQKSPYSPQDEIGGAIALAHKLIEQNAVNITQIKSAAEDKIHKLAYYDSLTGLPNRTLFLQKLVEQGRLIHDGNQGDVTRFAVITLDLDHFKDINDSMGHNVGDAILRGIGKRLRSALPASAFIARAGEDEYAVMMPLAADINSGRDVAEKIVKVIRNEPFKVFNENFQVRASVGVSTFPDDGMDPDQILKNADIALNRAKEEGRDTIKEYSEDFDRAVQQRFQMLRDLRDALDKKELTLYFQPQFDLASGKVIGCEALIRWFKKDNSKDGGTFISPGEFIPIAESSGLIVPMGEWVLRHACERAVELHKQGHMVRMAVNVSGAQFYQSDLVAYTAKVLKETGMTPSLLELEVTESVFMQDISHTVETLQQLHQLGVELAIDDFGTGYSSLSYLRQFPIDRLKIDQSFIRNALNNNDDAAIAKTIIGLGHSLNLKVIAEGVETKDHESFLMDQGCDEVQGFRYSRPVPYDDLFAFVQNYDGDLGSFDKAEQPGQIKAG